jgi:hypothetical protein
MKTHDKIVTHFIDLAPMALNLLGYVIRQRNGTKCLKPLMVSVSFSFDNASSRFENII